MIVTLPSWDAQIVAVARAVVGATPRLLGPTMPPEAGKRPRKRLYGPAVHLVEQTLARGVVLSLARRGGATLARHVVDGEIREGRLWDRHPLRPFAYSPYTFELLRLLAYDIPSEAAPRTLGDHVVAYLAADYLRQPDPQGAFRQVARSPLPWLSRPERLVAHGTPPNAAAWPTLLAEGRPVLEALQPNLAQRVLHTESIKRAAGDVVPLGEAQETTLNGFFDAAEAGSAVDLTRFVCLAAAQLAADPQDPRSWFQPDPTASLADRARMSRAAASFLRVVNRRAQLSEQHSAVRFFDDAYDVAQLLLEDWALVGVDGHARLRRIAEQLQPYTPAASSS